MAESRGREPTGGYSGSEIERRVLQLLGRAQYSAVAALIGNMVLTVAFLWAINPTNLGYSAAVIVQNWPLAIGLALAWALPVATFAGSRQILELVKSGKWDRAQRLLAPMVVTGYVSWIVSGYFLHEGQHLLQAWVQSVPNPSPVSTAP